MENPDPIQPFGIVQQIKYPLDYASQAVLFEALRAYFQTGFLAPQYTTAQRDNLVPTAGLIIFNTTTSKLNFYTGSAWEAITSA